MTVVCWDGTTLAADRMVCLDGYSYAVTKVHRIDRDTIVGCSGGISDALQFVQWLRAGSGDVGQLTGKLKFNALVVKRTTDGLQLLRYESGGVAIPMHDEQHAMGVGGDYAAAAMHLGCNARRAVEVACALCELCGHGVDTMTLDDAA